MSEDSNLIDGYSLERQYAWELFTEIVTRVSVEGNHPDHFDFDSEILYDSFTSLHNFLNEARKIMRQIPVESIDLYVDNNLGYWAYDLLKNVIRPFIEKWEVKYRFWWENKSNKLLPPLERQKFYPEVRELILDWGCVRRDIQGMKEWIRDTHNFTNLCFDSGAP